MPLRLVALDEGPDIPVDRAMVVVGRHPQCDARLDSIRVSRRHCCMTQDSGEVLVRDLGSTNGIRINGQRVEMGRLKAGDELSIAHIRFRLDGGEGQEATLAEPLGERSDGHHAPFRLRPGPVAASPGADNPLAAAVRDLLPSALADRCRIQVIVQMKPEANGNGDAAEMEAGADAEPQKADACPPDSSH
jgi:hypothetical protein